MKLSSLPGTVAVSKKRVGRGYGSGKGGHNSGRGTKGQKARNSVPLYFVGTSWVWFKRLPFIRGKSRFSSLTPTVTLTLDDISRLPSGTVVNKENLYKHGIITKGELSKAKFKVVGTGKVTKKLTLAIAASKSAMEAVQEAGGETRASNT